MGRLVLHWVCVLALVALPVGGCSEETAAAGGTGGGTGGTGGSAASCEGTICPCTEAGILAAIAQGGGPYTFACDGPTTVTTEAEIVIDNDVELDGEGNLTVDGNEDHRVFSVAEGATAELRGLTVAGGFTGGGGGGISNGGTRTLTLTNSTMSGNTVVGEEGSGLGGGILNDGTLTLTSSTVSGNTAGRGGGIYNVGALTLTNSTASGNSGLFTGGILNGDAGTTAFGTLTLTNSTVSGNSAGGGGFGSGIGNDNGNVVLTHSVVDGDCAGDPVTSNGYNIESPGDTCGFDQGTDQVDVSADDLKLGPLQDNGGPTMTHALGDGSVAIDVTPIEECEVETDQRGVDRPQGDACDVGAFESARAPALASYCAAVLECFSGDKSCEAEFANLWVGSGGDLAACTSAKSELVECAASLDCDKLGEASEIVYGECQARFLVALEACEVRIGKG